MIRKMQNPDINRVADIWLKTNLKAHDFIPEQYWTSNYELVKEMMSQAEVYVYEDDKMIQGFVGLSNEYIEGIFVSNEMQSCGIGKLLLDYIIKTVTVDYWIRIPKKSFREWYEKQSKYRTQKDREKDKELEGTTITMPEMARLLGTTRSQVYEILKNSKYSHFLKCM